MIWSLCYSNIVGYVKTFKWYICEISWKMACILNCPILTWIVVCMTTKFKKKIFTNRKIKNYLPEEYAWYCKVWFRRRISTAKSSCERLHRWVRATARSTTCGTQWSPRTVLKQLATHTSRRSVFVQWLGSGYANLSANWEMSNALWREICKGSHFWMGPQGKVKQQCTPGPPTEYVSLCAYVLVTHLCVWQAVVENIYRPAGGVMEAVARP